MRRGSETVALILMMILLCVACEHLKQPKPQEVTTTKIVAASPASQEYISHTVKSGETMGTISKWYSGTVDRWHEIAAANPQSDTRRLQVGEILKIPASMAVVHADPPSFSTAPKRNKGKQSNSATSGAAPAPEPVFGPR